MSDFFEQLGMYPASMCRPRIARILESGGSAMRFDGQSTRILFHHPVLHRPMKKLPWPLSTLQPHICEYVVCGGNFTLEGWSMSTAPVYHRAQFKRGDAETYISSFLDGAEPNEVVAIH